MKNGGNYTKFIYNYEAWWELRIKNTNKEKSEIKTQAKKNHRLMLIEKKYYKSIILCLIFSFYYFMLKKKINRQQTKLPKQKNNR